MEPVQKVIQQLVSLVCQVTTQPLSTEIQLAQDVTTVVLLVLEQLPVHVLHARLELILILIQTAVLIVSAIVLHALLALSMPVIPVNQDMFIMYHPKHALSVLPDVLSVIQPKFTLASIVVQDLSQS